MLSRAASRRQVGAMIARVIGIALVLAIAILATMLATGSITIPDRWNPAAPLAIADEPNLLTGYKLARLETSAERCRTSLSTSEFRYQPLPDRELRNGCGYEDAVRVEATSLQLSEPFTLTCQSAVALALWERHVVQPAAQRHFGITVARLQHLGSYACRNLYGEADARRSEHASANALDVAAFTLADGRSVRVLGQWNGDAAASAFLHDVHSGACRFFDVALGPDYNAAHRDHFHLDRGRYRACR